MDRRRFLLTSLAGALATPLAAEAQRTGKVSRVGYLGSTPLTVPEMTPIWTAFVDTLRERGWIEGQNIFFERRYAEGRVERFDELAIDLGRLRVDVIVAASHPAAMAARKATSDNGLVASLAHPGGRVTGVTLITQDVAAKGLELLKDLSPRATRVGFL